MTRTSIGIGCEPPSRSIFTLFEHAQQFGLRGKLISPISSRKIVPPLGRFEFALALARGAGKSAFLMAEEFGFDQFGRKRGAVHRDELAFAAMRAPLVNSACDQFLAGARLAAYQYGDVGRRDLVIRS